MLRKLRPHKLPGPKAAYPLAHLLALRRDLLGFLLRLRQEYGDVASVKVAGRRLVLLSDPEAIHRVLVADAPRFTKSRALKLSKAVLGEGLLTSEGDFHLRQRRMIAPAFHRPRMADYAAVMTDCSAEWRRRWRDGGEVDMAAEMSRLALVIVGRALFGADVRAEVDEIGDALTTARGLFHRSTLPFAEWIGRLPLASNRRFREAKGRLDETIYRLIARQRGGRGHSTALLSRLLQARDEGGDEGAMSDEQVRDEALTLLLAGHETTAVALAWTWLFLADHPEVEAKLHDELDRVLAGQPATMEDLPNLPYLRQVLTESMRLRPPAYTVARTPREDYRLDDHILPAGSQVLMSQYVMHRDPRFYDDPERFRPERWTPDFIESLPRFAYFPFGGGPRTCIGEGFAWAEAMIVLATLASHWRARPVPDHPTEPEPMITLRPRHGLRMTLHRREPSTPEAHSNNDTK